MAIHKSNFKVSVVIPVFNEENTISFMSERLLKVLSDYPDFEIIFVDDGSRDNSLILLKELHAREARINFLSFSRNFGHQSALRAGIAKASGNCIISLDGDLQHPPEMIPLMIKKWQEGFDVVFTKRMDSGNSFYKSFTSKLFYKLMNAISDVNLEQGEADFRLIDRCVANELNQFSEDALFFRGIIKWLGFSHTGIEYLPDKRHSGKSRYSGKKMFSLAISGVTGFSIKPLRISAILGLIIAFLSILYGLYALYIKFFTQLSVPGWTSVFFMVTFIGGIQLIILGIIGEYVGHIFMESKKRPHYVIREESLD